MMEEDDWKNDDFLSLDNNASSSSSEEQEGGGGRDGGNQKDAATRRNRLRRLESSSSAGGAMDISDDDHDGDEEEDSDDENDDSSVPPWMTMMDGERSHHASPMNNPLVALHNEIINFVSLMEPTDDERRQREDLVEEIRVIAGQEFGPHAQVLVFGSQATGLFLPSSDIDIVIVTGEHNEEEKEPNEGENVESKASDTATTASTAAASQQIDDWKLHHEQSTKGSPLQRFASVMREAWYSELSYLEVIENTRIPLVKCTHASTNISIDVSFDLPGGGPPAATLMNTYLDALPPLRPLTILIKSFLAARGLNQPYTGGVGSFMIQVMIVAFLQQRERDAVVHQRRPNLNMGALLLEFFELYGLDLNYVTTGISVRHDGFFFPKGAQTKKDLFYSPERPYLLALENPLDTTMDVGKSSFRIQMVQRAFKVAHNVLVAQVTEPVQQFAAAPTSILASILPPTDDMFERRRLKKRQQKQRNPMSEPQHVDRPLTSKRYGGADSNDAPSTSDARRRDRKRHRRS